MKSVKKFTSFEALKADKSKKVPADQVLKNHEAFSKLMAELLIARKQGDLVAKS